LHDGVSFEQFAKPALVLCTRPFVATARSMAAVLKVPDYRFVVLEHPIGSRTAAEIRTFAEEAYRQGVQILAGANR
jgi:hypothetical protein